MPAEPLRTADRPLRYPQRRGQPRRRGCRPGHRRPGAQILVGAAGNQLSHPPETRRPAHRQCQFLCPAPLGVPLVCRLRRGLQRRQVRPGNGRRGVRDRRRLAEPQGQPGQLVPARAHVGSTHPVPRRPRIRRAVCGYAVARLADRRGTRGPLGRLRPALGPGVSRLRRACGLSVATPAAADSRHGGGAPDVRRLRHRRAGGGRLRRPAAEPAGRPGRAGRHGGDDLVRPRRDARRAQRR